MLLRSLLLVLALGGALGGLAGCNDRQAGGNGNTNANNNNVAAFCGDGRIDVGEQCDDGPANSDSLSDACRTNCRVAGCGDAVLDTGEECDDGDDGQNRPDACPASCRLPVCGDGHVWLTQERCDDGNTTGGDGCSADCAVDESQCGDGFVDTALGEECDDQNLDDRDGCSRSCQVERGWSCSGVTNSVCVPAECGDGLIAVGPTGEPCDDGNKQAGDGCASDCTVEPGWNCSGEPSVCDTQCGDGIVAGSEACDDGDSDDGDGCSAVCLVEAGFTCGGSPSDCGQCGAGWQYVPAGSFEMGCNASEQGGVCDADEAPRHTVFLSQGYCIQLTEVTVGRYRACKQSAGCPNGAPFANSASLPNCNWSVAPGSREDYPMNCLVYADAEEYCAWEGGDLPTEAQWERAARGEDGRTYPWGSTPAPTCGHANLMGCTSGSPRSWPVGSASPLGDSPYGLQDMAGNVWEWTRDWYSPTYYADACSSGCTDPLNATPGSDRVIRGGAWNDSAALIRASSRYFYSSTFWADGLGWRCVRAP